MTASQRIPRVIAPLDTNPDGNTRNGDRQSPLEPVNLRNSWIKHLSPESEQNYRRSLRQERLVDADHHNRTKRPVFNGHYVIVPPTGIRNPKMLLHSKDVAARLLAFTDEQMQSRDMLDWLSGNAVLFTNDQTWATPYALSIMGSRYTSNCPYGTGNGYGDGRAISIGEVQVGQDQGYELQLKGGGTTPFHRGADGRAVLRSSIREFLASEAMHYMGVRTTRALSLIVSSGIDGDTVQRPWYSDSAQLQLPTMDDPRLARYSLEERKQLLRQLRTQSKADPNTTIREPCAITCRVASSFTRIGHIDLFARRVQQLTEIASTVLSANDSQSPRYDVTTNEWKELEQIIWHACFREFKAEAYDPYIDSQDVAAAARKLLELSSQRIAEMVANWIRVGFAQGNFNADNCLVGGKTMDYGPFGFIEEYSPLFAKWTGSGQHFGFLNQPSAGLANVQVLIESVVPVIIAKCSGLDDVCANTDDDYKHVVEEFVGMAQKEFQKRLDIVLRNKMGLPDDADVGDDLWESLEPLMRKSRVDWTIFWRQLTYIARDMLDDGDADSSPDFDEMMKVLEGGSDGVEEEDVGAFYEPLEPQIRREWLAWLEQWYDVLTVTDQSSKDAYERMRTTNPKYVLREWMLVDAYTTADQGDGDYDTSVLAELFELIQHPYDEGTEQQQSMYYRRAPASAQMAGGTAFMS